MRSNGYLNLKGGQVHYISAGEGDEILILIHQASQSSAEFATAIPFLARHYRVIALDLPGHGHSYSPEVEYEIGDYVEAIRECLSLMDINSAHFVGHHGGAGFCIQLAARYPELIKKMVLANFALPVPDSNEVLQKARDFMSKPSSREIPLSQEGDFLTETWSRYIELSAPGAPLEIVFKPFLVGHAQREKPYDAHFAVFRGLEDIGKNAKALQCPTALISGAEDFFISRERLLYTQNSISNCKLYDRVENAGAFIAIEQPEAFSAAVIDYLMGE